MLTKIMATLRRWSYKLGLIRGIEKLEQLKDINISEEMLSNIEKWKQLYAGFYAPHHRLTYSTIAGEQTRNISSLQMPKIVAGEMAGLVFNERCEINIDDDGLSEFIEQVFKENKFTKEFQDYLEYMFAYGGMVVKPYAEDGQIKLSFVTADCFIPIAWHNDNVTEGVFIAEYKKGDKTYTHLEWHTWENTVYTITNELYESNNGDLGVKVDLAILFPDLQPVVYAYGVEKTIFTYFKPNTANNLDTETPLGIPLYANALDTMRAIDTAFDSLHREFRLGKKRILVPSHMVKVVIDPATGQPTRYFDASDETYEAMNSDMDSDEIKDINVELRVEEHIAAINALLNLFAMQTGFSAGTFSFDGQSVKTATEVVSENSKTFKSKKSHEIIIEEGIKEVIASIVAVAKGFGIYNGPDEYEVTVSFDDSIIEDENAEIQKQILLVTNGLTSKLKALMKIHRVTEEEAEELLTQIKEDQQTAMAESIDFFGVNQTKKTAVDA